ncbi:MAG: NADH-quinone oxidoreductase subunit A [Bacteroidota bacterium]
MQSHYLSGWAEVVLFLFGGLVFTGAALFVSRLIRPNRPNAEKLATYESGEQPAGSPWIQFNIRFYVIALVFLLFEVELVFLFPWATIFADKGLIDTTNGLWGRVAFVEMLFFVGILALGLAYAWAKGHLDWVKPKQKTTDYASPVPRQLYDQLNERYKNR